MKRILLLGLAALFMGTMKGAANAAEAQFSRESFTLGSTTLPYRKANICPGGTSPTLVLYLHGGSSRGSDNEAQLKENAVSVISQYLLSHGIPATFLVPQCPSGGGWTGQLRKVVYELLKSYIQKGLANPDRIYILGGSMGGTGTWAQLSYFPDFYAAAMPVAGNPTGMNAANVATTPVLTVMGTDDSMMSIDNVESFMSEVINAGGSVQLDIEQGWSHPTTCEQSYTDTRLDWLFSQHKNANPTKGDVNGDGTVNLLDVTMTISRLLGLPHPDVTEAAADMNGNGKVDISDVTSIIDVYLEAK